MPFNIPIPSHSLLFNSHSLPSYSQFLTYFLTWESHSHGIPVWDIPIPSHSHSVSAKVVYKYGNNYNIFLITEILIIYYHYIPKTKTFACWFSLFRLQSQADGAFSVINYAKYSTNNLISSSQHCTFGNKFPWQCR